MHVDIKGFAGDLLDECAQDDESDVGVVKGRPGIELQRCGQRAANAVGLVGGRQSPRTLVTQVAPDTRGVREQHAHGDLRPAGIVGLVELRQVGLHRFVECDRAFFVELQHGGSRRDGF